ncbi:MAG: HPP family protein [Burkholderiaceae bacterium]
MSFWKQWKATGAMPPKAANKLVLLAAVGGFLAIAMLALLAQTTNAPLILGSFGASCVIVFGLPDAPFAQPRNVIFGHLFSSFIGLLFLSLFGAQWWSMALAVGTAIAVMMLTRTVHPPAGSNPVIVMLAQPGWGFLLTPTLLGAVGIVLVALVYNNYPKGRQYPKYW